MNEKNLEYFKQRSIDYEFLFKEQQSVAQEYRKLVEDYQNKIKEKDIQIAMLMNERNYHPNHTCRHCEDEKNIISKETCCTGYSKLNI